MRVQNHLFGIPGLVGMFSCPSVESPWTSWTFSMEYMDIFHGMCEQCTVGTVDSIHGIFPASLHEIVDIIHGHCPVSSMDVFQC